MKPDILTSWPRHMTYPLWQEFIHQNRDKFNKVIVVFTDTKTEWDYRQFVQDSMAQDNVIFLDNDEVLGTEDWRDKALNKALRYSTAEWVWFTEQDFTPLEGFWEAVDNLSNQFEVFGYYQGERLHPCCIFIKRSLLDSTAKNFGVLKDKLDHFGLLQRELVDRSIPIGIIPTHNGYHLNALSQNTWMLQSGQEPNYQPNEFKAYCKKCLDLTNLNPDFKELFEWYLVDR